MCVCIYRYYIMWNLFGKIYIYFILLPNPMHTFNLDNNIYRVVLQLMGWIAVCNMFGPVIAVTSAIED